MAVLGLFNRNTGALEGSDDPGKVFVKGYNVRALLCAWSLLSFQGCDGPSSAADDRGLLVFTSVLVFLMMLPLVFSWFGWFAMSVTQHEPEEPTEPTAISSGDGADPGLHDTYGAPTVPALSYMPPNPHTLGSSNDCSSSGASSSNQSTVRTGDRDASGMPRFEIARDLPLLEIHGPHRQCSLRCMRDVCVIKLQQQMLEGRSTLKGLVSCVL